MRLLVDLVKVDRLDRLIRRKAIGSPMELANRLMLSRSSLFEIISFLREVQAPISYSKSSSSCVYDYPPKFYLVFERDKHTADMYNLLGKLR